MEVCTCAITATLNICFKSPSIFLSFFFLNNEIKAQKNEATKHEDSTKCHNPPWNFRNVIFSRKQTKQGVEYKEHSSYLHSPHSHEGGGLQQKQNPVPLHSLTAYVETLNSCL